MRIEISPDQTKILKVEKEDNPWSTAQKFCFHYGLDDSEIDQLADKIAQQKDLIENQSHPENSIAMSISVPSYYQKENQNNSNYPIPMRPSHKNSTFKHRRTHTESLLYDMSHNTSIRELSVSRQKIKEEYELNEFPRNKGEELYMKGLKILENSKVNQHELKKDIEQRNSVGLTFKPKIGKSHKRVQSVFKETDFMEKLIDDKERKRSLVAEKCNNEVMSKCSFKPKTNKISNEIIRNKTDMGMSKHENLYSLSKYKKDNYDKISKETSCTFKPYLYRPPIEIESKLKNETQMLRASKHIQKVEMKIDKIRDQEYENEQKNFFKPKVGRGPSGVQRVNKVLIHEHLYKYKDIYDNKRKELRTSQELKRKRMQLKVNLLSDTIVED